MAWRRTVQFYSIRVNSFRTGQASPDAATTTGYEQLGEHGTSTEGNVADNEAVESEKTIIFNYPDIITTIRDFIGKDPQQLEGPRRGL